MIIMLCLYLQWLTRRQAHLLRAQQGIPISEFGVSVDKHIVYFHLLILYSVMVGVLYFSAQPFFLIFSHPSSSFICYGGVCCWYQVSDEYSSYTSIDI